MFIPYERKFDEGGCGFTLSHRKGLSWGSSPVPVSDERRGGPWERDCERMCACFRSGAPRCSRLSRWPVIGVWKLAKSLAASSPAIAAADASVLILPQVKMLWFYKLPGFPALIRRVGATFSCVFILSGGRTWELLLLPIKFVCGEICQTRRNLLLCLFCLFNLSSTFW